MSFQYLLLPIALTIDDTHIGPVVDGNRAWSELSASGVTNETLRSVPFAMSLRIDVSGAISFLLQSLP